MFGKMPNWRHSNRSPGFQGIIGQPVVIRPARPQASCILAPIAMSPLVKSMLLAIFTLLFLGLSFSSGRAGASNPHEAQCTPGIPWDFQTTITQGQSETTEEEEEEEEDPEC